MSINWDFLFLNNKTITKTLTGHLFNKKISGYFLAIKYKIPHICASNKKARVAELVDAHVSGACAARRGGSSPPPGTTGVFVNSEIPVFFRSSIQKHLPEIFPIL